MRHIIFALALISNVVYAANFDVFMKEDAQADQPGPEAVAISLMSQFYEVTPDAIGVTVHHETATSANITATAPGGHSCVFSVVPAPPGAPAPNGWMVGSTVCNRHEITH